MKKYFKIITICSSVALFLSLNGAEDSSSSTEASDTLMQYISDKNDCLKRALQDANGITILQELKKKCDDRKYKLSKEHKKILKKHKILIKEAQGCCCCFNVKKRFVVCQLIKSQEINRFLNEHSIQSAESSSSIQTKESGEMLPKKESAEELEQVV